MLYSTLFFDLDDTLYPNQNGLWQSIRNRMNLYMVERLGLPAAEVPKMRAGYYKRYGTTLRGLQKNFQVDAEDYLAFVHDLPLEQYLQPAPRLKEILLSLPQPRWIFTNADSDHAGRVLAIMELDGCFEGIIDVRAIQFACKPEPVAYERALALAGNPQPSDCVLLDDSLSNLATARQLGFTTVLIQHDNLIGDQNGVSYIMPEIEKLPEVFPELWR